MASTPKNICTHNTEQVITAKKTFTDSIVSNRFELLDGTTLKPPAIETMNNNILNRLVVGAGPGKLSTTTDLLLTKKAVVIDKEVSAHKFTGDASGLINLPSKQITGPLPVEQLPHDSRCFEIVEDSLTLRVDPGCPLALTNRGLSLTFGDTPAVADASKFDHILVNSARQGVGRLSVSSLMGHIAAMNSQVLNVVNGGETLGQGISVYKGKVTKGRNQNLQFKTLVFDDNFVIEETENEISISIKDLRLQEIRDEEQQLKAEVAELEAQKKTAQVMTIKALEDQISHTLGEMDKAQKEYRAALKAGKSELRQMMSALGHLVE
jgi:hypothetical protein